eukprot:3812659-Pleurochrysis_carterae.AAC.2
MENFPRLEDCESGFCQCGNGLATDPQCPVHCSTAQPIDVPSQSGVEVSREAGFQFSTSIETFGAVCARLYEEPRLQATFGHPHKRQREPVLSRQRQRDSLRGRRMAIELVRCRIP